MRWYCIQLRVCNDDEGIKLATIRRGRTEEREERDNNICGTDCFTTGKIDTYPSSRTDFIVVFVVVAVVVVVVGARRSC